ncbi:MAG: HD domain-containing protein [Chloroflexi bacterium]|nr:HD domain-containing protein [Chloroflexota bacterium]
MTDDRDEIVGSIRDSLYDRLPLTRRDLALMDTPAFLRLDEIKQLGFISKVWPGAKHTRFEHSLGVAYLARQAFAALAAHPLAPGLPRLTPADGRALAAAALLHDIGHYPFSHCLEELGPPVERHEAAGRRLIETTDLADILARDWAVDPGRVAGLIAPREPPTGADALLSQLLSGALDLDKLDYLPRDAKACNVPYGRVDTPRLLAALRVRLIEGAPRIVVTDKGVSPLHSLINARQEMFDNVYWHHTNRACMVMLQRAAQEALLAGALPAASLTDHTDASLLAVLAGPTMPPATRDLVTRLGQRRIHKRGLEISSRAGDLFTALTALYRAAPRRRAIELRLAARLAALTGAPVADYDLLIDVPKPERWSTDVWISYEPPPLGFTPLMHWTDAVGLGPDALQTYEDHQRRIRLVIAEPLLPAFATHCGALIEELRTVLAEQAGSQ